MCLRLKPWLAFGRALTANSSASGCPRPRALSQLCSMLAFSCMVNVGADGSARKFFVGIGVLVWLISMGLMALYVMGNSVGLPTVQLDLPGPLIGYSGRYSYEFLYYAVFSFFTAVAFLCGATHVEGQTGASAATFFMFVVMGTELGAGFFEYQDLQEVQDAEYLPDPSGGAPASVAAPTAY